MAKSMAEIRKALLKAMTDATNQMAKSVEHEVDERFMDYYTGYYPVEYNRTGAMSYAPQKTDAVASGSGASAAVYLNTDYSYDTGTWSGYEVIDSANKGLHGGIDAGDGVCVWDDPMNIVKSNSRSMWERAFKSAGVKLK